MKIVCDCGQVMEFKIDKDDYDEENGYYAKQESSKIEIHGEHDEVWISCQNEECKMAIHFFT